MVNKIYVKQIRSPIRRPEVQRKILKGLGLNKMNKVSELNDTPSIRGMINKIPHLVQVLDKISIYNIILSMIFNNFNFEISI